MDNNEFENERAWYVVQSYSGMEQAAKKNLERRITSLNMQDYIFRVLIPETVRYEKKKNGEMKEIVEKVYPGYIFVDMIVTDESWFVVRNTPMVTGFLGSSGGGAKPVPLPNEEIIPILRSCGITIEYNIDFKVGDTVNIVSGPFAGQTAIVESMNMETQQATVLVDFFGRQTPQELSFDEIKAIKE
ncbi:MAG: transcription termination/antitermination protein NusG [Bacilli bacterium]